MMRLDRKTQEKYNKRLRYAERKAEIRKLQQQIEKIDATSKKKRKKLSSSKIYLVLMIIIAVQIVFFIEYITVRTGDTSCLYVLASIPVTTLVPSLLSYFKKSRIENSAGGIVYDIAINSREDNVRDNDVTINDVSESNGIGQEDLWKVLKIYCSGFMTILQ